MTRSTLAIVVAFPLLLIGVVLESYARLHGEIIAEQQSFVKSVQINNAAAESIVSGQLTPAKQQITSVFKAAVVANNAAIKSIESLWNVMYVMFWLVISFCLAHVALCINIYRKQKKLQREKPC